MIGGILGLARAFPLITIVSPLLSFFLTNDIDLLLLSITLLLNDGLNHFLKYSVLKPLMGKNKYPIIGPIITLPIEEMKAFLKEKTFNLVRAIPNDIKIKKIVA